MRDEELEVIEAHAAAATPGPWVVGFCLSGDVELRRACGISSPAGVEQARRCAYPAGEVALDVFCSDSRDECSHPVSLADAVFIAAARTDVPALAAEVRRLRSHVGALERGQEVAQAALCSVEQMLNEAHATAEQQWFDADNKGDRYWADGARTVAAQLRTAFALSRKDVPR